MRFKNLMNNCKDLERAFNNCLKLTSENIAEYLIRIGEINEKVEHSYFNYKLCDAEFEYIKDFINNFKKRIIFYIDIKI